MFKKKAPEPAAAPAKSVTADTPTKPIDAPKVEKALAQTCEVCGNPMTGPSCEVDGWRKESAHG